MLKIKSGVSKISLLNYVSLFTDKEIYIAKKCILNKMKNPPNYDVPDLNNDMKSVVSQSMLSQMTEASF